MSWKSGYTVIALYIALLCATSCLWPGLIRRQPEQRVKALLFGLIFAHALILYVILFCDLLLVFVWPDDVLIDHFRRLVSRWGFVLIYGTLLCVLWQKWPISISHGISPILLLLVVLLLSGAAPRNFKSVTSNVVAKKQQDDVRVLRGQSRMRLAQACFQSKEMRCVWLP